MRKRILLILLLLILPLSVSASTMSLKVDCPDSVNSGETFSCTVSLTQSGGVKNVSGNFHYDGLTYNNFDKNGDYDESNISSTSFSLTKSSGFDSEYTLGNLSLTMPDDAVDNNTYNIYLKNNSGKDLNDNNIVVMNTVDTIRVKSRNNDLKKLSVSGSDINFNPDTLIYNVETNSATISISATAKDIRAKVTGAGLKTLNYGLNTYNIIVTPETGNIKTYTININRNDTRNGDSSLSNLEVSKISFDFNPNIYTYNLETENSSATITATPNNSKSKVTGTGIKSLSDGLNTFDIKVTAENGNQSIYTLNITKTINALSDATLSKLSVTGTNIAFSPNIYTYNLETENSSVVISATPNNSKSKVEGIGTKSLNYGLNTFNIKVTSPNNTKKTYTLKINRIDSRSDNTKLSSLKVSNINFDFDSNMYTYNLETENSSITITAVPVNNKSKVTGTGIKSLSNGLNTFDIKVTAENGNQNVYTLNITKTTNVLSDATLSQLNVTGIDINFSSNMYTYNLETENSSVTITATPNNSKSKVEGIGTKSLSYGLNTFNINVTSPNNTKKTYTLKIYRNDARNDNTKLSSLKVSNINFDFDSNQYTYNLETNSSAVSITATPINSKSKVNGAGSKNLNVGLNTFEITVTASNNSVGTYILNIYRNTSTNSNVSLSKISIPNLSFTFASNILNYNLKTTLDEIVINAESNTKDAVITGTGTKKLTSGQNLFEIKVSKGESSKIYKLYINKVSNETNIIENGEEEKNDVETSTRPKLSQLAVTSGVINFNPDILKYNIEVKEEYVNVIAKSNNDSDIITGTGLKKINIGLNVLEVKVTNEENRSTSYLLNITRKKVNNETEKGEEKENIDNNNNKKGNNNNNNNSNNVSNEIPEEVLSSNANISNIIIKDHEFNYNKDVKSYTLITNYEVLDIEVILEDSKAGVEISGNYDLKTGSKIVISAFAVDGTVNSYEINIENVVTNENIKVNKKSLTLEQIIILIILFILILILLFIIIRRKSKKVDNTNKK